MESNFNTRVQASNGPGPAASGFAAGVAGMQQLAGNEAAGSFTNGNVLTLRGANATAGALTYKVQSADGAVESILGSIGTNKFTVDELPDVAGIGYGGGTQLGIDVLRDSLKTLALMVSRINYDAGSTTQLAVPIKFYTGNIYGNYGTVSISVGADVNNMQQNATLVPINRRFTLASNSAISLSIRATTTVTMTLVIDKVIPYNYIVRP